MRKQHFSLLSLWSGLLEGLGFTDLARNIPCIFINAATDLSIGGVRTAIWFARAHSAVFGT